MRDSRSVRSVAECNERARSVRASGRDRGRSRLSREPPGVVSSRGRFSLSSTDTVPEASSSSIGRAAFIPGRGGLERAPRCLHFASYRCCSRSSTATPTRTTSSMLLARPAATCASARRTTSSGKSMWLMSTPSENSTIVSEKVAGNNRATGPGTTGPLDLFRPTSPNGA